MRKMSVFFYCLCAGMSPLIFTNPLMAVTLELGKEDLVMDFFWTKDDEKLYFNFDIPEGMSFEDDYFLIEEAQMSGCEFIVKGNGNSSTQMKMKVLVENVPQIGRVRYKIESVVETSLDGFVTSETFSHEGTIKSLQINLKKDPMLRIKSSHPTHGIICFKQM